MQVSPAFSAAGLKYNCFVWQILSASDLCSAYLFLARNNLKKRNLEAAEMYAHKCCEFNEVGELFSFFSYHLRTRNSVHVVNKTCLGFVENSGNMFHCTELWFPCK